VTNDRCPLTALQPSGVELRCEHTEAGGFGAMTIGNPAPAFRWVLCDAHAEILHGHVQATIFGDIADQAAKMGVTRRDWRPC
jgi:hypothetical protein